MGDFHKIVTGCRGAFKAGRTLSLEWRMKQLKQLLLMLDENESVFVSALAKDLRKPEQEAITLEVEYIRNDVRGCINNVQKWMKDFHVEKNIVTMLDQTYIHYDPYGVVLILGAWNYPLQLTLAPIGGALSAGNCVILKPSELSPATAEALANLVPKYLDPDCVKVVTGGIPETTKLLEERFDYIFFTGSTGVGKIVREASNKYLTPVTLELGGKSPVFVDSSADMDITVKRVLWAKCINLGQTCIAPDYLLCTESVANAFIAKTKKYIQEWYGTNPQTSPNLCRIVNERNFERLRSMLEKTAGEVAVGGGFDKNDLYMAPTLVKNVQANDSTMQSEIFGPILPICIVNSKEEAIDFIGAGEKPLTAYVFTKDKSTMEAFKNIVTSGSMVFNDAIVHLSIETLPFGGVGQSGMGSYHGKYTFLTFSHKKSILVRDFTALGEYLGETRYPPYSMAKVKRMAFLVKNRKMPDVMGIMSCLLCFALGAVTSFLALKYAK